MLAHVHVVDIAGHAQAQLVGQLHDGGVVQDERDVHLVIVEEGLALLLRYLQGLAARVAIDAGRYEGKGDRRAPKRLGKFQRAFVAAGKKLGLVMRAATPHGAHGMDHILCGQGEGGSCHGRACVAVADLVAGLLHAPCAGSLEDGPADASSSP